jgi:hypothetical protein
VEALRPDLYFVVPLAARATAATVFFATTKQRGPGLPVNVRVLSWVGQDGNIYDGDARGNAGQIGGMLDHFDALLRSGVSEGRRFLG